MIDFNNKKILITYLLHFGDLVTITPFLEILRRHAKNSEITLLVDKKLEDVVKYNPNIDHIETIDKKGKDNSISGIWRIGKKLRKQKFDITINLHENERTFAICLLANSKILVGESPSSMHFLLDIHTPFNTFMHASDRYIDILNQLGIKDKENSGLQIFTSNEWDKKAENFYIENNIKKDDKLIGFHVGSAALKKCWKPENFAKVADYFSNKGYKTIIFGSNFDKKLVNETVSNIKILPPPIIATGKFTIGEFIAALKRCSLFISNDSGPMHAAASQKLPIVGIFSSGNPTKSGPYGTNSICLKGKQIFEFINKPFVFIESSEFISPDEVPVENVIKSAEKLLKL